MKQLCMLVGLLQHQYSYIEALRMHRGPVWCVVWCVSSNVAADVACLDDLVELAVAGSI